MAHSFLILIAVLQNYLFVINGINYNQKLIVLTTRKKNK